jgi:ligand-binding SRPBCC domain-containing protein
MGARSFVKQSIIHASPERVFTFHELPDALRRLTPPWESAHIVQAASDIKPGSKAIIETHIFGLFPVRWVAEHTAYDPPYMFEDVQVEGPFRRWLHRHIINPHPVGAVLRDEIEYELPLGFIGQLAGPLIIVPRLEKLFDYRHLVTREWCEDISPANAR